MSNLNTNRNPVGEFFLKEELRIQTRSSKDAPFDLYRPVYKKRASKYSGWELIRKQNQYLFTFYILIHLFFQDDNLISKSEQKIMKHLIKEVLGILTPEQLELVISFSTKKITLQDVSHYIEINKLPDKFVKESMDEIKKILHKHKEYLPFTIDLEKHIYNF